MTRGRAPNLALPLTKALAQQRDYRARKAANIARLEKENDQLRDENSQLAKELEGLRNAQGSSAEQERQPPASTSSAPSSEANARMVAEYQYLRANYEALEAEVRRKEHVLQVLRDKEQEAFARLEGLLKQSYDVVGSGAVAQQAIVGGIHQRPSPVKEEPLQNLSNTSLVAPSVHYGVKHQSAPQRSSSFAGGYPAGPRDPGLQTDPSHADRIQSAEIPAHGDQSLSPDSESWRSRKRLRSSSVTLNLAGHPQQYIAHQPFPRDIPLEATNSAHEQPLPYSGPFTSVGPGGPLGHPMRRPPSTHFRPIAPRHPDVAYQQYPLVNDHSPRHSLPAVNSALQGDPSGRRYTQPSLSTMTPPISSHLRDPVLRYNASVPDLRLPQDPASTASMSSRDDAYYRSSSRMVETPLFPARVPEPPRGSIEYETYARGYTPDRSAMPNTLESFPTVLSRPRSGMSTGDAIRPLMTSRNCGPASKCASSCGETIIGVVGSAATSGTGGSTASGPSPRPELPSINALAAPSPMHRLGGNGTLDALPAADCCHGLFDCTSLPSSLWMPLHAMSTSYERGNAAAQAISGIKKADTGPVDLGARPDRSAPAEPSPSNAAVNVPAIVDREERRVRSEEGPPPEAKAEAEAEEGKVSAKTANEECCFGILQCDEAQEG